MSYDERMCLMKMSDGILHVTLYVSFVRMQNAPTLKEYKPGFLSTSALSLCDVNGYLLMARSHVLSVTMLDVGQRQLVRRIQLKRVAPHIPANILLPGQMIQVVMNLRQNMLPLQRRIRKLRQRKDIIRLTPPLLKGVIHQHRIALIPPLRTFRSHRLNPRILPDLLKSFVALHPLIIVHLRQPQLLA